MKRYFLLFLLAALACGCSDSEGDTPIGTGSETQQPVSADEILPRRLVSVDVTSTGNTSYSETYAYDEQGRLASLTRSGEGYSDTYTYTYADNTIVQGKTTFQLQDGRAVLVRMNEGSDFWTEMKFDYDAAGYVASLLSTEAEGFYCDCAVTYAANGVSYKVRGDEWSETLSIEFDRAGLNNLNLDFYGGFCDIFGAFTDEYPEALLLGVGGQRLRYLPKTIQESSVDEDGSYNSETRYVYHMDGDYLSEVEIHQDGELSRRIAFHYE